VQQSLAPGEESGWKEARVAAKVVTFAVQLGSGGNEIAREIAQSLGYRFLDHEVISRAAEIAGVSPETIAAAERWPTFVERMLERLALTTVVSEGVLPAPPTNAGAMMLTSADYRALIEQVVHNLAEEGSCVIVGHAAQAILHQTPQVFKVLVHGSKERRAARLAGQEGIESKEAIERIKAYDSQRNAFFKHAFGLDWLDSTNYDITINTDDVDSDTAASWILTGVTAVPDQLATT
jgi:cytidylate kinase